MTKDFWYWLFFVVALFWNGAWDYRGRAAYGNWWWGRSLWLFLMLLIIGLALFKDPLGTLVK